MVVNLLSSLDSIKEIHTRFNLRLAAKHFTYLIKDAVTCCEWPISTNFFLSSFDKVRLVKPGYLLYKAPRNNRK